MAKISAAAYLRMRLISEYIRSVGYSMLVRQKELRNALLQLFVFAVILIAGYRSAQEFVIEQSLCAHRFGHSN